MTTTRRDQLPAAVTAFDALHDAIEQHGAACRGDARFIDDETPTTALVAVCARCPVFAECDDYGRVARPPGGVWAGRRYSLFPNRKDTAA